MRKNYIGQGQPSDPRRLLRRPSKKKKAREEAVAVARNDGQQPDGARRGRHGTIKMMKMRFATWNVGSMNRKSGEIVHELRNRKVDVCCVQETRQKDCGVKWMGNIGSRYRFFWQGNDKGFGGVGILVAEEWTGNIQKVEKVSDRLLVMKLVTDKHLLNLISVYAPQAGRPAEEKDAFWNKLYEVVGAIPPSESILIGGDLNGHVGATKDGYDGVHGGMGYGTRNAEGESILEFCSAVDLSVCNTFFKKAVNHQITFVSGNSRSQIDYVMVRRGDRRMVSDIKVIAGLEIVQQHRLVVAVLLLPALKKCKTKHKPRLKLWKLNTVECREKFQNGVLKDAEKVNGAKGIEGRWTAMKEVWLRNAEEVCGWTKGGTHRRETWWWNDDVAEAVRNKQVLFRKWKNSGEANDRREYVAAKRASRRAVWEAKEKKCQELATELESEKGKKDFFKIAKQMAKERQEISGIACMKDDLGNIKFGEDVKEVWRAYMEKLLNEENAWDGDIESAPVQGPGCLLAESEFKEALAKCSPRKAAGPSGIVIEMISASGVVGIKWMTELCNTILSEGHIPADWTKSTLIPFYKNKGDPLECGSYRGIKLLEQALKLYERVLEARIRERVCIDDMQFGFMPGKGTTDAIFIARQMQEKHLEKSKDLYLAFVDLEKAFDRVPREVVRWALRLSGVEECLVDAVMTLFKDANTVVRTSTGDTNSFGVKVGVHQGSVLSPLLFAIVMDVVSKRTREGLPWEILYADDLVLMADSEEKLTEMLAGWRRSLSSKGLKVNTGKTKVMVSASEAGVAPKSGAFPCGVCRKGVGTNAILCTKCRHWVHKRCSGIVGSLARLSGDFICRKCQGRGPRPSVVGDGEHLEVEGERYGVVTSFCYLGDMLDGGGGAGAAITARIRSGWKKLQELAPFLTSRGPSLKLKGRVFETCVRSCLLYGSETWAMTDENERRMKKADTRMMRRMCGPSLCERHSDSELRGLTGLEEVDIVMRRRRLRWYGHIQRKDEEDWTRKTWKDWEVDGTRPRGRPKKTWDKTVKEDLRKVRLSPQDALDRVGWKKALSKRSSLTDVDRNT